MVAYTSSPGIEGSPLTGIAVPWGEGAVPRKVALDFDWARLAAARLAAGFPALGAGDTIVLGTLPKGTIMLASASNVTVANGAAAAISVGVTGTAGAVAAAVATGTVAWAVGVVSPVTFAVDTPIILTLTAVPTTGKTRVIMLLVDMV